MESAAQQAAQRFTEGFNCAQSVLAGYAAQLGLDEPPAMRVASAFGGGMCHLGQACGAVVGALMAIGLRHGRVRADDAEAKARTHELARRFTDEFLRRHGHLTCTDLLGVDLDSPEGIRQFRERNLRERCAEWVRSAAEIVAPLL